MITPSQVGWAGYQQYEGPWFRGLHGLPTVGTDASFEQKVVAVITATEGGHFDAINMYDRMICSVGLVQWGDAGQFSVCRMLGEVAKVDPHALDALHDYVGTRGFDFTTDPKGFWRFSKDGVAVDTVPAQRDLYLLGSSGLKGEWSDEQRAWAIGFVVAMQSVWDSDAARDAQTRFTGIRLRGFAMPSAYQALFNDPAASAADPHIVEAAQAAFLSFAANLPAVAAKHLAAVVTSSPKWTIGWLDAMVRELTFGPGIAIYPHRYDAIRPVIERLWSVDLPDTSADLQGWYEHMGTDPSAPPEVRLDTPLALQQALLTLGADLGPGGPDGKWGNCSKAAMVAFQTNHGLLATGQGDLPTIAALRAALLEKALPMPLQLNFRVEDRGGVMFVVRSGREPGDPETITVASNAEVELWNALASRLASPHRESYIRVSEQDMVEMLLERAALRKQLIEVREHNSDLRGQLAVYQGPTTGPVCRVCGMPATHRTIPSGSNFFCAEHVLNIRSPTELIPPPSPPGSKEPA